MSEKIAIKIAMLVLSALLGVAKIISDETLIDCSENSLE